MTEDELKNLFSEAGTVIDVAIILDRVTGRSRGFGFVEMATEAEAAAAVQQFDGKDYEGRRLAVNEARPMEERPARPAGGPRRDQGFRDERGGDRRRRGF